jgi:hypothetical protein
MEEWKKNKWGTTDHHVWMYEYDYKFTIWHYGQIFILWLGLVICSTR